MDPELKDQLYQALDRDGERMKDWFLRHVDAYLAGAEQIPLPLGGDDDEQAAA